MSTGLLEGAPATPAPTLRQQRKKRQQIGRTLLIFGTLGTVIYAATQIRTGSPSLASVLGVWDTDASLRTGVEESAAADPRLRELGLHVQVVEVTRGFVTLGLLDGPAGTGMDLTGTLWAEPFGSSTLPNVWMHRQERYAHANLISALGTNRKPHTGACTAFAEALTRNQEIKTVRWVELPSARARRLFVEAGTYFWAQDSPFAKRAHSAYRAYQERDYLGRVVWPHPRGMSLLIAGDLENEDPSATPVEFHDMWRHPEQARLWMQYFTEERESELPLWFVTYREAWRTDEFWTNFHEWTNPGSPLQAPFAWEEIERLLREKKTTEAINILEQCRDQWSRIDVLPWKVSTFDLKNAVATPVFALHEALISVEDQRREQ